MVRLTQELKTGGNNMANEMTVNNTQVPAAPKAAVPGCIERTHRYTVVDEERAGKIMDDRVT